MYNIILTTTTRNTTHIPILQILQEQVLPQNNTKSILRQINTISIQFLTSIILHKKRLKHHHYLIHMIDVKTSIPKKLKHPNHSMDNHQNDTHKEIENNKPLIVNTNLIKPKIIQKKDVQTILLFMLAIDINTCHRADKGLYNSTLSISCHIVLTIHGRDGSRAHS